MDETNAKREARRRRILENSENRLRKITGRTSPGETKDSGSQVEDRRVKAESNYQDDIIRTAVYNTNNTPQQDCAKSENEYEGFLNDASNENVHLSGQASKSKSILHTLLFKRINFVLLAGIINILLLLKLDKLFGQAIIVPYLLLAAGRLYRYTTLHDSQNSSLLVAALLLCNVKPKIIYMFKLSFTLFTVILSDFSLFMFNFVLMRYIIIRYYYYEATLPNA
ncbi:hypothetical protein PUN28_005150 [Cardiocondyla obscurior]|uniref:Uncharacterized protein n=2 Tax=Cardiocondyla obscurior TaxID=286306 RepID=A0AAW2GG98_9HYME